MNNKFKFLIPLLLALLFLFPTKSLASPTIPPTEKCLSLTALKIKSLPSNATQKQKKKAAQTLVDAGCISKNPFDEIPPVSSSECQAYLDAATEYLAPVNEALIQDHRVKSFTERMNQITKNYDKRINYQSRMMNKAFNRGKYKLATKISKKINYLVKKKRLSKRSHFLSNPSIINNYLAKLDLITTDIVASGCYIGRSGENAQMYLDFSKQNNPLFRLNLTALF